MNPKFLYSYEEGRHFILHTGFPRFFGEFKFDGTTWQMNPELIDEFPIKKGDEKVIARLMREAGDFFISKNFIDEKMEKFLLCENPLKEDREFILHTRFPKMLFEIRHFLDEDKEEAENFYDQFEFGFKFDYGFEIIIIGNKWIEKNSFGKNKINKIVSRMADWYEAYLNWEDSQDFAE